MSQKRAKLMKRIARATDVPVAEFYRASKGKSHKAKASAYTLMERALRVGRYQGAFEPK